MLFTAQLFSDKKEIYVAHSITQGKIIQKCLSFVLLTKANVGERKMNKILFLCSAEYRATMETL
jgi:hypothetical protein